MRAGRYALTPRERELARRRDLERRNAEREAAAKSQPSLFAAAAACDAAPGRSAVAVLLADEPKLAAYIQAHPDAYREFVRETERQRREQPGRLLRAKRVAEDARDRVAVGPGAFRIDNSMVSLFARLYESERAEDVFTKKRRKGEL